jgi:hypothetical protein
VHRRRIGAIAAFVVLATACGDHPATVPSAGPARTARPLPSGVPPAEIGRDQAWAQDIAYLIEHMESLHPDLYHGMPTAEMAEGARSLVERLQSSSDDEILVGLMGLAALVSARGRDGHMGIWPPENPGVVHRYPIRLWEFPDGLHVTAARAPNERLVGSRMVAIDGVPIGEVLRRLDPVVPRDNGSGLRASRTVYLTSAEVLAGLGIARRADRIRVEVADATGRMETATIVAVSGSDFAAWVSGWELALPRRGDMLLLRDPTADHWTRYLESARALYVQYNEVLPGSSDVVEEIRADLSRHDVERIVLDLRNNGGGEAEGYRQLLDFLAGGQRDLPGGLVVLIGRLTFSAGASFVAEIERDLPSAALVGEPTGGAPNFWADVAVITLPNSRLRVLISTTYEGYGRPNDPRLAIDPDRAVALSSTDYFSGRDPVLDAALAG